MFDILWDVKEGLKETIYKTPYFKASNVYKY